MVLAGSIYAGEVLLPCDLFLNRWYVIISAGIIIISAGSGFGVIIVTVSDTRTGVPL